MARASRKNIESFNKQSKDLLEFNQPSEYTYSDEEIKGTVIALFKDGNKVDSFDDEGEVIFDKTPFYAEMGGQVADTGEIENDDIKALVTQVSKAPNKQHLHHVKLLYGELKVGDKLLLKVDHAKHFAISKNHSGTHLLQTALIEVLGDECKQKGSYVDENYLRFDFSFTRKLTSVELSRVERKVNEFIAQKLSEKTLVLPIEEANKVGAISLFGEKYGDVVRVVTFGDVSKEFCGGNHVKNSADIGVFVIQSEEAIASGVRRIQATTGLSAYEYLKSKDDLLNEAKNTLEAKSEKEILTRSKTLLNEKKELLNTVDKLTKTIANFKIENVLDELKENKFSVKYFDDLGRDGLMNVIDGVKAKCSDYVLVLIGKEGDKHPLLVSVSKSFNDNKVFAGNIVKKVTSILGGNGGGKPELAQGSVVSLDKINQITKEFVLN